MRAAVRRVSEASVTAGAQVTGAIGRGFSLLVCAMAGDTEKEAEKPARRAAGLAVETGVKAALINHGPVTIPFGTAARH